MPLTGSNPRAAKLRGGWRRRSAVTTGACEVIREPPRVPRRPRHFADLRSLLLAPPDAELLHPAAQRARVHAEQARRAVRTVHPPVRAPEDREDVIPLDQRERDGVGGRRPPRPDSVGGGPRPPAPRRGAPRGGGAGGAPRRP